MPHRMRRKPVDVIVSLKGIPEPPNGQYAVLLDRNPQYLEKFAVEHPECFVIPFFTKDVSDVPNCSALTHEYVLLPYYVGNLTPRKKAIAEIVSQIVACFGLDCILNEAEDLPDA
jgi:hypothetical protein